MRTRVPTEEHSGQEQLRISTWACLASDLEGVRSEVTLSYKSSGATGSRQMSLERACKPCKDQARELDHSHLRKLDE